MEISRLSNHPTTEFSRDDGRLAVGTSNLTIIEPKTGTVLLQDDVLGDAIWYLQFDNTGNRLALCPTGGKIVICNAAIDE